MNTGTSRKNLILNIRKKCCICGSPVSKIMDLPGLPFTGMFSRKKNLETLPVIDQSLMWCPSCGHGQLLKQVEPGILYDYSRYSFRSSVSVNTRQGTEFFLHYLRRLAPAKKFKSIFEPGCNDLYLLKKMKKFGGKMTGLDPVWKSGKCGGSSPGLRVVGDTIEKADFEKILPVPPDLVVCRHTLEHIADPVPVMEKIIEYAADDALLVFEVPCFETLIERRRFDQVFHEHLQYFSRSSVEFMLYRCGAELVNYEENYSNWGSIIFAFRKGKSHKKTHKFIFSKAEIENRIKSFRFQMECAGKILGGVRGEPVYGYGAALMLPVLSYHMENDLSFLEAVLDDDKSKDGLYYANLPVRIRHVDKAKDLDKAAVLITAPDNVRPIMQKLLDKRPVNIICPFIVT